MRKHVGRWWAARSSKPVGGMRNLPGGFDSHVLPPNKPIKSASFRNTTSRLSQNFRTGRRHQDGNHPLSRPHLHPHPQGRPHHRQCGGERRDQEKTTSPRRSSTAASIGNPHEPFALSGRRFVLSQYHLKLPVTQPRSEHGGNLAKTLQPLNLLREERDLRDRQLPISLPQLTQMTLLLGGLLREER